MIHMYDTYVCVFAKPCIETSKIRQCLFFFKSETSAQKDDAYKGVFDRSLPFLHQKKTRRKVMDYDTNKREYQRDNAIANLHPEPKIRKKKKIPPSSTPLRTYAREDAG